MKLVAVVLFVIAVGSVGFSAAENTDIDWSTVRPLWQIKEWQDKHPAHMKLVREQGLLERERPVRFGIGIGGRITGGHEAARHQFPYMAGLVTHMNTGNGFCGGSIISKNYVMTAAHCLDTAATMIAVLGAHNVFTQTESTQQRIFILSANFILYPGWDAQGLVNDIAVVRLPQEANYGEFIRSVRLPNWRQVDLTFAGQLGIVSGWGRTSQRDSDLSQSLQFVRLPVITNLACRTRFPLSGISDEHVCADGGQGGPCTGDMGGPLSVIEADGVTTQIGVVSFGLSLSCEASWPSVYMRITSFLEWIDTNTDGTIAENWN